MSYRENCDGCAERDAEIARLRAEVTKAKAQRAPRWVVVLVLSVAVVVMSTKRARKDLTP